MVKQIFINVALMHIFFLHTAQPTILFIDTLHTPAYVYHDLLSALQNITPHTDYRPWYDPAIAQLLNGSDYTFINCGAWLLNSSTTNTVTNLAIERLNRLLEQLKMYNGTLCFLVPDIRSAPAQTALFNKLIHNSPLNKQWIATHYHAITQACAFLCISDAQYSGAYPTTLLGIRPETVKPAVPTLPNGLSWLPKRPQNAPLGIQLNDGAHTLILLKASRVTAFGIAENFVYTPCIPELFELYKTDISRAVCELFLTIHATECALPEPVASPALKKYQKLPLNTWINTQGVWCGWAEIEPFFGNEYEWIKSLTKMRLNHIWFELNPEWYLSDNGLRKERKEEFLQRIAQWTAGMHKWQRTGNSPLRFFIGTDLTSNFSQAKVADPAVDMWGTVYDKIPAPLDFAHFWQPEFITVFDRLMDAWKSIGNGMAPGGVFLDLEMYHAQSQTNQYSSTMDFSNSSWQLWLKRRPDIAERTQQISSAHERINFLVEHNLLDLYFKALQQEAFLLGKRIREYIHSVIPGGLIGVYAVNLPHSWFYLGFLAGLSTRVRPLLLATFNHRFAQHQEWLESQGIYAYHMAPYLLSKLQKAEDAPLISTLAHGNSGVWFNKIRLPQSRDKKDWAWDFGMEVTPLETEAAIKAIAQQIP